MRLPTLLPLAAAGASGLALTACGGPTSETVQARPPLRDGSYTGSVVSNQFGDIQVDVTVSGGTVTAITAPVLPTDHARSAQLSAYAGPILQTEALRALATTGGPIDLVSGATYTSEAFVESLQSAVNQAG